MNYSSVTRLVEGCVYSKYYKQRSFQHSKSSLIKETLPSSKRGSRISCSRIFEYRWLSRGRNFILKGTSVEQTRYYNTSTRLARSLSREKMVILLVNWIGTRAPSETSGKKRKRMRRTKRKLRFFSSRKIESYVRTIGWKFRLRQRWVETK